MNDYLKTKFNSFTQKKSPNLITGKLVLFLKRKIVDCFAVLIIKNFLWQRIFYHLKTEDL